MARHRLTNGMIVTDDLIAALVTEAEEGYAPAQVRSSRVGRPPSGDGFTRVVQFRVEEAVFEALLARAREEEKGISEIAREALVRLLCEPCATPAPSRLRDADMGTGDTRSGRHNTPVDPSEQVTEAVSRR